MRTFLLVLIAVFSYFMGNLNGSIIASRLFYHEDIRSKGSGNPGLTNFQRTYGAMGIAVVLGIDIVKTLIPTIAAGLIMGTYGYAAVGRAFAGFCVILGHNYPALYDFRGGKGALCSGAVAFVVDWRVGIICIAVFALLVIFTRYVSLGSIVGSICFTLLVWSFGYDPLVVWLTLFTTVLLVFKHRGNLVRLISGKESRIQFGKNKSAPGV